MVAGYTFLQMFKTKLRERSLSFQPSPKTDAICSLGDAVSYQFDHRRVNLTVVVNQNSTTYFTLTWKQMEKLFQTVSLLFHQTEAHVRSAIFI